MLCDEVGFSSPQQKFETSWYSSEKDVLYGSNGERSWLDHCLAVWFSLNALYFRPCAKLI